MYPTFLRRMIAVSVDQAISIALAAEVATSDLLALHGEMAVAIPIAVWLLLEPLMTALWCTPGQYLTRTRVRRFPSLERPGIVRTIFRWSLRVIAGYHSMIHAPRDPHRRGAHDLWSGTVVVFAETIPKPVLTSDV
jgi:hypothetical protein